MIKEDKRLLKELYEEASLAALARRTGGEPFLSECVTWFLGGMKVVEKRRKKKEIFGMLRQDLETNRAFASICGILMKLEATKGKHYRASWMKRGELFGVKANIDRKYDRISACLEVSPEAFSGETLTETIGDLAVYSIKWLVLRACVAPEEFMDWVRKVAEFGAKNEEKKARQQLP